MKMCMSGGLEKLSIYMPQVYPKCHGLINQNTSGGTTRNDNNRKRDKGMNATLF